MNFYLASGFNNRYAFRELAKKLEEKGHTVKSSWIYLEERASRENSQEWDRFAGQIALQNLRDLEQSNAMIVDQYGMRPDGNGGAHFESGYGVAAGMTMFLVGFKRNTFHWLKEFCVVENYEELLDIIPDEA